MGRLTFCILCATTILTACQRRGGQGHSTQAGRGEQRPISIVEGNRREKTSARTISDAANLPTENKKAGTYSGSEIFEKYSSAVFVVYTQADTHSSQGSAFFISSSGLAVSNYHVFESTYQGMEEFHMSDGSVYKLKRIVAKSKENDIFIFEVNGNRNFNYIPISSRIPRVGERIYTIGSPQGLENTFSSGEISQLRGQNIIQISAPIDHGSSGGVLLNEFGEAIGITTAGIDDSGANLNFAISTNLVKLMLE